MTQKDWRRWLLTCPECGDPTFIELPLDVKPGRTGAAECARRHPFAFQYDGHTVETLGALSEKG
jgi:hypothetical protein